MEEFFSVPRLRVYSAFTLSAHRQALRVLAAAAVIVVASEIIGIATAPVQENGQEQGVGLRKFVAIHERLTLAPLPTLQSG